MSNDVSAKKESFFSTYDLHTYPKGQILFINGDEASYVYYLVKGKVKQYDITYQGEEIILNVFKPGAFFPMSLVINGGTSPYIFAAETEIEVRRAPAQEALQFIRDNPDVLYDLLSRVYRGTDELLNRITQLMSGSAKSRVLFELYTECRRFGKIQADKQILLSISETELAARAGLSRETVSREFQKLKNENIVRIVGSHIYIKNPAAIQKYLDIEM